VSTKNELKYNEINLITTFRQFSEKREIVNNASILTQSLL
jgi:hypothetical protein